MILVVLSSRRRRIRSYKRFGSKNDILPVKRVATAPFAPKQVTVDPHPHHDLLNDLSGSLVTGNWRQVSVTLVTGVND